MTFAEQLQEIKHYRNAYFLAVSAAMGSVFYGYDIGIIGGVITLPAFKTYFGINEMSASAKAALSGNIVAILQGGCFFGALGTGYFSNRWGRKPCMIAAGLIYIIGSVIQAVVGLGTNRANALSVLYFARFFRGSGRGDGQCARAGLANNVGIMLSYWVNYSASLNIPGTTDRQWRMPFAVQVVPGVLFCLLVPFQPESPRFLVEHGQYERAARSLAFVARTSPEDKAVLATIEEIKADFAGRSNLSVLQQIVHMFDSRAIALRCFIPSLVMFFQQWTGTNAINYFSPQIFASLGISGTTSGLLATGVYGVVKVISVALVLAFAVEGIGRKKVPHHWRAGAGRDDALAWRVHEAAHPAAGSFPPAIAESSADGRDVGGELALIGSLSFSSGFQIQNIDIDMCSSSFTISKLTPIMLNSIKYGTFLLFGFCCLTMAGVGVRMFARDDGLRARRHPPVVRGRGDFCARWGTRRGGRLFLGGRRGEASGKQARAREVKGDLEEGEDEISGSRVDGESEKETEKKGLGEVDVI
ncbi:hypothetical protein B0H14DRAFT_3679476 [Mycena olivaceomarginata]|nr:hypothetical protein B0H14DRAFT_3679476 [Mycena olivaceomarginata]